MSATHHLVVVLQIALLLLLLVDFGQTWTIATNPHRLAEVGAFNGRHPVLPRHPSVLQVCAWFAVCTVAAVAVPQWVDTTLPQLRVPVLLVLGVWILLQVKVVINNLRKRVGLFQGRTETPIERP
jgi:hypothetical protein